MSPALTLLSEGRGPATVETHPDTGEAFDGVVLPDWADARRMVCAAAKQFLPVRTLGWDVAFTPGGPIIVEGNVWWDYPNPFPDVPAMREILEAEVRALEAER